MSESFVGNPVAIRLERCGKTFADGTRALESLDLDVQAGETLVLLGPSGCGKTTMLRIIAGLESTDAGGRVLFGADDVTMLPIERRNVGMVFQSYALFPNMTVAENVGYGLKVRGIEPAARAGKVGELLEMMRLTELGHRRIDQLSGGQKQRVALARALIVQPRVLLLDEPLTALDAKLREALRAEIDALLRSLHITSIYVTHDQAEAMALGDRVAVMERGRIAQIGTPQQIYYQPANAFVADFIGTMNRVGDVAFRPEDVRIVAAGSGQWFGRIVSVFFLGDRTRLIVDLGDACHVVAETSERRTFAVGERLDLAVNSAAHVRLGGD
ncbi:MAG: ABC transporter ATP-binding protein [Burkholderiales bacterium]